MVISNSIKYTAAFVLILMLIAVYIFTPLFPNCECAIDILKRPKAYIKSQLRYTNERIWLDDVKINIKRDSSRRIDVGVANRLNRNLTFKIAVTETSPSDKSISVETGKFEYPMEKYTIKPEQNILVPITYHAPSYEATREFGIHIIDMELLDEEVKLGRQVYEYASSSLTVTIR